MTDKERREIADNIKEVLENTFSIKSKRTVLEYPDRINFACPYCGDSENTYKKRGNIYLSNLSYHCFNCNKHTDYFHFLKDFGVQPSTDAINVLSGIIANKKAQKNGSSFDLLLFNEMEELALTRREVLQRFRLIEIPYTGDIHDYLKSRYLLKNTDKFMYSHRKNELYVLNLTKSGKIAGFQIRSFDTNKVKYRTFNISKIYECLDKTIDEKYKEHLELLNQISITFNIMRVELLDTLYVFEGGIDSFFIPNSIGMCGVGRSIDLVEDLPNTRYFFDNDKAGYKKTMEKSRIGKSVFLWDKFLTDNGFDHHIKDLNELVIYLMKNKKRFDFSTIDDWFSSSPLDIIDL